ncbi:MAG: transposase [Oligoflexus sp.]|nr:transposase [Oligoflexus sp.]
MQKVRGEHLIHLPAITGKRKARTATLQIKYERITLGRAEICKDKNAPKQVELFLVEGKEILSADKIDKVNIIDWKIYTTHVVESVQDAIQILECYTQRWNIEQLFRMLKICGLNVEASQLTSLNL